jgi:predicted nucleic acid-binding protein
MKRFLLDSNAVNDFINHREPLARRSREARQRGDRLGTCEPVVAELFYGLEFSS